ncbi:MAG: hypothetical protein AAGJ94_14650 [Pseudomonadota bacterium]
MTAPDQLQLAYRRPCTNEGTFLAHRNRQGLEMSCRNPDTFEEITQILGAALRGAGNKVTDDEVGRMHIGGGLPVIRRVLKELADEAFGTR